jgi:hypothetical protein
LVEDASVSWSPGWLLAICPSRRRPRQPELTAVLYRRGRHAAPRTRLQVALVAVLYGLIGLVLLGALLIAVLRPGDRAQPPVHPSVAAAPTHDTSASPALATVEYEVISDGPRVDVTYVDRAGVHSLFGVPAPWSTRVQVPAGPLLGAFVTARAAGRAGIVSCRIVVDGARVAAMSVRGSGPVTCYPGDG